MKRVIVIRIVTIYLIILLYIVGCTKEGPAQDTQTVFPPAVEPSVPAEQHSKGSLIPEEPTEAAPAVVTTLTTQAPAAPSSDAQMPTCSRTFSPQFAAEPYYTGPLFDAHFHLPPAYEEQDDGWRPPVLGKEVTIDKILCLFDQENVKGAYAFTMWEYGKLDHSLQGFTDLKKRLRVGFHLFLIPSELEGGELADIVEKHPQLFDGFGEIVFYDPERAGATPEDPVSLDIHTVAGRHGFIVMFHPDEGQRSLVEHALKNNPETKFLLHGWESADYISELMDKYPNVYYSVDSATLYAYDGMLIKGPRASFTSRFRSDFRSNLNSKADKWKSRIERHPDRFMWGTDRAADWHFDEEISRLFEEFARAFIGRLSPDVQEKYAYKNAEQLVS